MIRMRMFIALAVVVFLSAAVVVIHAATAPTPTKTAATSTEPVPSTDTAKDADAAKRTQCNSGAGVQECCSKRGCAGNVLSNRDAHNCKRTGGKSWHNKKGACTNL